MERLLAYAESITGIHYDISSFADIVEAIHIVQSEMGITGTTADEAAGTISGAVATMKAAWENWKIALADPSADIGEYTDKLINSAETVFDNVLPVVTRVLGSLVPVISEKAPELVQKAIDVISENLPLLINSGVEIVASLTEGLVKAIPDLVKAVPDLVKAIAGAFSDSWPELKEAGATVADAINEGIQSVIQKFEESEFVSKIIEIMAPAKEALSRLSKEIGEAMTPIIDKLAEWKDKIKEYILGGGLKDDSENVLLSMLQELSEFIVKMVGDIEALPEKMSGFLNTITGAFDDMKTSAMAVWSSIKLEWDGAGDVVAGVIDKVVESATVFGNWCSENTSVIENIAIVVGSLAASFELVTGSISAWKTLSSAFTAVKTGISALSSPVNLVIIGVGVLIAAIVLCIKYWDEIKAAAEKALEAIKTKVAEIKENIAGKFEEIKTTVSDVVDSISAKVNLMLTSIKTALNSVKDYFSKKWEEIKGVFKDAINIGSKIVTDIKQGISDTWDGLVTSVSEWWDGLWSGFKIPDWITNIGSGISGIFGGGGDPDEKRASGLDYVPYNGYPATLHRGEAVLTAREAEEWRGGTRGGRSVTVNIYPQSMSAAELDRLVHIINTRLGAMA